MVNLYKLLNVLEQGMTLFQLNKWKTEGIWYPITQYKKESDEIQVVTNLFIYPRTKGISHSTFWKLSRRIRSLGQVSRGKPMENLPITCKHNASLLAHRELSIILYSISTRIHIHNR
jgi:hypothetical protein